MMMPISSHNCSFTNGKYAFHKVTSIIVGFLSSLANPRSTTAPPNNSLTTRGREQGRKTQAYHTILAICRTCAIEHPCSPHFNLGCRYIAQSWPSFPWKNNTQAIPRQYHHDCHVSSSCKAAGVTYCLQSHVHRVQCYSPPAYLR